MSELYSGRQFVGIDLHRRRSVVLRMTAEGDPLDCVRISNDVEMLSTVMARAGEAPEVVLEAYRPHLDAFLKETKAGTADVIRLTADHQIIRVEHVAHQRDDHDPHGQHRDRPQRHQLTEVTPHHRAAEIDGFPRLARTERDGHLFKLRPAPSFRTGPGRRW